MRYILALVLLFGAVPVFVFASTHSTDLVKASSQAWHTNSHTGLAASSAMTACAWVNLDNESIVNQFGIVSLGADASFELLYTGDIALAVNDQQTTYLWTGENTDTWYHLCASFDGAQIEAERIKFYVDGTLVDTAGTTQTAISASSTDEFAIGTRDITRDEADSHRYFDGQIDDVRVWTRALSDSEVAAIHTDSCSTSLNGANLGGWWKFDNDATDSSGNGNTLTGLNSPTFTTDKPFSCATAPTIEYFNASPSSISSGGSSTLSWSVSGATLVSINQGVGTVAASSTTNVSPTNTTVYTITASNQGLATTTDTVTVTVSAPPTATAVRKSIDESVVSSTTLQADDELTVSLETGKTYFVEGALFVSSANATPDIKISFTAPGGSEFDIGHVSTAGAAVGGTLETSGAASARIQIPANTVAPIVLTGSVVAGADGALSLSWAQFASNVNAVLVREGSYLKITEL